MSLIAIHPIYAHEAVMGFGRKIVIYFLNLKTKGII